MSDVSTTYVQVIFRINVRIKKSTKRCRTLTTAHYERLIQDTERASQKPKHRKDFADYCLTIADIYLTELPPYAINTNCMTDLALTLEMASTQIVETSVTTNNSPSQEYSSPDDQPPQTIHIQLISLHQISPTRW